MDTLVADIFPIIYSYLDKPSKAMFALTCRRFLKLGIPPQVRCVRLMCESAKHGYTNIIQWTRGWIRLWSCMACENASRYGHLETLIWLRQNNCYWDSATCNNAVKAGRIDILEWILNNGGDRFEGACHYAVERGDLAMLKLLRHHECPWNRGELLRIATPEISEWINNNSR